MNTSLESVNMDDNEDDTMDPRSNLKDLKRKICVVTTAALPWRTGTSVNPLARALYLTRGRLRKMVTLVVPWLPKKEEQAHLFGDHTFETEKEQENWIREYCKGRMGCEEEEFMLRIMFYEAYYNAAFGSIFPAVDICSVIPDEDADIAILEEPEHLTWFRVPEEVEESDDDGENKAFLGWKFKFKYVVGILHTNYDMYIKQYGIGTSFIAAPVLSSLSSLVVQAYCHRVIRLSATLPHLDPSREKTCNVHGVRSEFFEPPTEKKSTVDPVPVYFIGKLVWAKGFDKLLDMADAFKRSTGEYFPIDIYGSGKEEESIRRAFLGRKGVIKVENETENETEKYLETPADASIQDLFSAEGSLRKLVEQNEPVHEALTNGLKTAEAPGPNPLDIIGDISGKSVKTGVSATNAVGNLFKRSVELGFHSTFSENLENDEGYHLDLPRSKYELRQHPIPARFLGLIDHVAIRDIPKYKIFLNLSESEVLCTTTAEALAMGKWIIIPKHPSNEFFLEFHNCLAFSDENECIEKIQHALANDPQPLSEMDKMKLSWEGAIQRLFRSAMISTEELEQRDISAEKDLVGLHTQWTKSLHTVQSTVIKTASMLTQR